VNVTGEGRGIVGDMVGVTAVNALHYTGFYLLCTQTAISKIAIQPRMLYTLHRRSIPVDCGRKTGIGACQVRTK